jgi:protein ImuB
MSERTLILWHPDWAVAAAGWSPDVAVAVVAANRVVAASSTARACGVQPGLRRREAQRRCSDLVVTVADPSSEARAWEPVVAAVEMFTPQVEVVRPGLLAMATRGPSRYHGGDRALAVRMLESLQAVLGGPRCCVGVADGRFAAELAARAARNEAPTGSPAVVVVPPGTSPAWLRPHPVTSLGHGDLVSLLIRLGIGTLGDLAALPAPAVLARFGPEGAMAHRLASGLDARPLAARTPRADLAVEAELEPPAERVDTAAFVAKAMADELHTRLAERGLACDRLAIEADTEHGEHLVRWWRHDGALNAVAIAERVRWQLDSWLNAPVGRPSAGLTRLRLVPDEVHPDVGRQLGFWGAAATVDDRVARSLARIQGLLGPESVVTAVLGGGRRPADQVRLVTWGDPREPARPGSPAGTPGHRSGATASGARVPRRAAGESPPWPGCLPGPAPARLHHPPIPAELYAPDGIRVAVTARAVVSGPPAVLVVADRPPREVLSWAGPWPLEERWWDTEGTRQARFQVDVGGGAAYLMVCAAGRWWVEGSYD